MMRAAWVAQELLTTFQDEIGEIALIPSSGGIFEIRADSELAWGLKNEGRFPEPKELKQRVRDKIAPGRVLGHADR
jgi:selenoprotein W-related protein